MDKEENKNSFHYKVFKDFGIQFDEKNNTYGTIRIAQWYKDGAEPDESKAKLEIRKFREDPDGEKAQKGYAFSTPEGPHELTEAMVEIGYGDTKKIIKSVSKREDFKDSVENIDADDDDTGNGEMFDMRSLLLGIDKDEDDE